MDLSVFLTVNLNHKNFILLFCFTTLLCLGQTRSQNKLAPNIVFIFSDDHATNAISAYGGLFEDLAPTPNIDRIASEGALLENALCTNAICGPSRASVLTGKYSHVNGYYKNYKGGVFDNKQWTFPQALKASGYESALVGKWHLASEPVGFDYYKYHISKGQQDWLHLALNQSLYVVKNFLAAWSVSRRLQVKAKPA